MPYSQLLIKCHIAKRQPTPTITDSRSAIEVISNICNKNEILFREQALLICLTHTNKFLCWYPLSLGGPDHVHIDIAVIATVAASTGAANIILAHNHPSGSLCPSDSDLVTTQSVKSALATIGRTLVDHIIFTNGAFYSLHEAGYI